MHEKCNMTPVISNKSTENQIQNYNHAEHAQQKSSATSTVYNTNLSACQKFNDMKKAIICDDNGSTFSEFLL
jgi:hypothetical protein